MGYAVIDHTGQQFGNLTVIERAPTPVQTGRHRGQAHWLCKCACGNSCVVTGQSLRDGSATKCRRCPRRDKNTFRKDLSGQVFKNWTVKEIQERRQKQNIFLCVCECGFQRGIYARKLQDGGAPRCTACGRPKAIRVHEDCL